MAADDFRVRLEGGAEVLEAAAVRLRALNGILDSLSWRERLAENGELVQAISADDAAVRRVLQRAERLQEVSPSRELERLINRVRTKLDRAELLTKKRAGGDAEFVANLGNLREEAAPTPEGDAEKWRTARALLRTEPRLLARVREVEPRVRELGQRPAPPGAGLPWRREEVEELVPALWELNGLCASLWKLLPAPVEAELLRHLGGAAALPDDAPALLLRSEQSRAWLRAQVTVALKARFTPLSPSPHEEAELLLWLVSARNVPNLHPASRAHLFALAASLAEGRPKDAARWDSLLEHARGAGDDGPDVAALLDNLKLFLRIQQQKKGAAKTTPSTLYESLLLLRELSS